MAVEYKSFIDHDFIYIYIYELFLYRFIPKDTFPELNQVPFHWFLYLLFALIWTFKKILILL